MVSFLSILSITSKPVSKFILFRFKDTKSADTAFGVFALLNMIIYLVWAIILSVHRHAFQVAEESVSSSESYVPRTEETANPSFMNNSISQQKVPQHDDETQDL